jgi:glucose uptake protein GlcU
MKWLKWFIAGTLAVPLFHQGMLYVLHRIAFTPRAPFNMTATQPFGVPQTFSLSFWGGVWGVILGLVLLRTRGRAYWVVACLFGAIMPTLVAYLVVAPLKGQAMTADGKMLAVGLLVNLAWGFGTAALHRVMEEAH